MFGVQGQGSKIKELKFEVIKTNLEAANATAGQHLSGDTAHAAHAHHGDALFSDLFIRGAGWQTVQIRGWG